MSSHNLPGKLKTRVEGLFRVEEILSESLLEIIDNYQFDFFYSSAVNKAKFFSECLSLRLSSDSEALILQRCALPFHRDARTSLAYGLELVFGWLSEDLIYKKLKSEGLDVVPSGNDKFREFLPARQIGTSPDFILNGRNKTRPLEIVFSWNNYWQRTNSWDLRSSKYEHLSQPGEESIVLGFELPLMKGFVVDMKTIGREFYFRSNPAWGNKPAYTLAGMSTRLGDTREVLGLLREYSERLNSK